MNTTETTQIFELAKRISKANTTMATQQELIKLYGSPTGADALAVNAAKLVFFGKIKLSFNY